MPPRPPLLRASSGRAARGGQETATRAGGGAGKRWGRGGGGASALRRAWEGERERWAGRKQDGGGSRGGASGPGRSRDREPKAGRERGGGEALGPGGCRKERDGDLGSSAGGRGKNKAGEGPGTRRAPHPGIRKRVDGCLPPREFRAAVGNRSRRRRKFRSANCLKTSPRCLGPADIYPLVMWGEIEGGGLVSWGREGDKSFWV